MKKFLALICSVFALAIVAQILTVHAAPYYPVQGGTGTSQIPASGTIPIGNGNGTYTPAYLLCSGNCSVANASGSVTISVPAQTTSTIQILPVSVATSSFAIVGDGTYINVTNPGTSTIKIALSTAQILQLISALSPLSYNSSTGQLSCASCLTSLNGALLVANNLSDVASTTQARLNLGLGSISTFGKTDYLTSSTVYVSSVNGSSGTVTITSSSLGVVYNPNWITFTSLSATGTGLTYNSSTGQFTWTNPGYITTSTYNASMTIQTAAPLTGGAQLGNGVTITLSCPSCIATTTGNWIGTWQGINSTTFYLATNPAGFITSASSVTWTAPQTFNAATVHNATVTIAANLLLASTTCTGNNFYQSTGSGQVICSTPSGGSSSTLIFPGTNVTTPASGTNGYTINSTYSRSATKTVCASNAIDITDCDYKATGTNDQNTINTAIGTGNVHVVLSDGTFNVSGTISDTLYNNVWISGQGAGTTNITESNIADPAIQIGTRQTGGALLTNVGISGINFTCPVNSSDSAACVKLDGFGNGSWLQNLTISYGAYGLQAEDLDRVMIENVIVNNPYTSGFYNVMGLENTWGNVTYLDDTAALNHASTSAWSFEADSDQSSPAAFARVSMMNDLIHSNNGVASTTGLLVDVPTRAFTVENSEFESNTWQIKLDAEAHITFIANGMTNNNPFSSTSSVDCVQFNNTGAGGGNPYATFISDTFDNCVNGFDSKSGYPWLDFEGMNKNDSQITNMFVGSWSSIVGTDFVFAGDAQLNLGFSNDRFNNVDSANALIQNLTLPSTTANSFLATNGSGLVVATGTPSGGGSTSLTATYVGYGSGSNTVTGTAAFAFTAPATSTSPASLSLGSSTNPACFKVWDASDSTLLYESFDLTHGILISNASSTSCN